MGFNRNKESTINSMVMFSSWKVQRKEKNAMENDFLMFGYPIKYSKEN